jgi:hypothetical protein
VYLALYGPEGLVIFDHPYNADYEREWNSLERCSRARRSPILVRRHLYLCARITALTGPRLGRLL